MMLRGVCYSHLLSSANAKIYPTLHKSLFRRSFTNSTPTDAKVNTNPMTVYEYCENQVKRFDHENYLVGLFMPKDSRQAYFAIRAFNIEIANIKGVVKDPMRGRLRILWWKDVIKDIYKGNVAEHPVVKALAGSINTYKLSKTWFLKLLDRRDKDLENDTIHTLEDLEAYAEETSSLLLYLGLECLGVKNVNADHAASHIGKANSISLLLRATPHHSSTRACYIPLSVLSKHGAVQEDIYRGIVTKQLQDSVYEVANLAKGHLDQARDLSGSVPKEARKILLSSTIADDFLHRLQKAHFNVFDPSLTTKHVSFHAKLWWNNLRGSY